MIQYFDSHIRTDCIEDVVLENLAYFNVKQVLLAAHAPVTFETGEELLSYFHGLLTAEFHRLQNVGLQPVIALGVHPEAVPRRAHYEVWRELPQLLKNPVVVGVGELALNEDCESHRGLLKRQMVIAKDAQLPVLVTTTSRERARKVRTILELVSEVGIPAETVLINHVDFTCLRPVLDSGCWAGVTVGPMHLEGGEAVELLQRYGDSAVNRVVVNSGLRPGPTDVLALPKFALTLTDAGFSQTDVRRLVWGNANRIFSTKAVARGTTE